MNMDVRPGQAMDLAMMPPPDMAPPPRDMMSGSPPDLAGGAKQALLVVGDVTGLSPGDMALQKRMMDRGFAVTLVGDAVVTVAEANAKSLVVIAPSILSGSLGAKLVATTSPVLCLEFAVFDEMAMVATGADGGNSANQTTITITRDGHPLAAGLTGSPIVNTTGSLMNWGTPAAAAVKVATIMGAAARASIFAYPANAMMVGLVAPAKRVGFYAQEGSLVAANADGHKLIDAAIDWTYLK